MLKFILQDTGLSTRFGKPTPRYSLWPQVNVCHRFSPNPNCAFNAAVSTRGKLAERCGNDSTFYFHAPTTLNWIQMQMSCKSTASTDCTSYHFSFNCASSVILALLQIRSLCLLVSLHRPPLSIKKIDWLIFYSTFPRYTLWTPLRRKIYI